MGDNEAPDDEDEEVLLSLRFFVKDCGEVESWTNWGGHWKEKVGKGSPKFVDDMGFWSSYAKASPEGLKLSELGSIPIEE